MLIVSLFLSFVPEGEILIISTLPKSPLGDLGAEMSEIDLSEKTQKINIAGTSLQIVSA